MKEKNVPITIRLPESRVKVIREMALAFGISPSRLASLMLETGFVMVDEVERQNQEAKSEKPKKKAKRANG